MIESKHYVSTVSPAPSGFQYCHPEKRDLLGHPVAVYAQNVSEVYTILENRRDRFVGILIEPADHIELTPISELAWHYRVPDMVLGKLKELCRPILETLQRNLQLLDQISVTERANARLEREINTTKKDYQRVNNRLLDQVHELIEAQQAYLSLNKDLENRVNERTSALEASNRDLIEAKDSAEQANNAKSVFLATMSHEIRTPMNGIIGMLELLEASTLGKEQYKMLSAARDSAFALLNILNDILDFSKIEAGRMNLESIPMSIRDIAEMVSETLSPTVRKQNLRLHTYVDPALADQHLGDEIRLKQILFNLCNNAIKFTETRHDHRGIVSIQIHLDPVTPIDEATEAIRITVADNGIGMTRDTMAQLFSPFTQGESSTTRRYGGTGLGLSICRHLVKMMCGEISVNSRQNEGTTFSVRLQLHVAPSHQDTLPGLKGLEIASHIADPQVEQIAHLYLQASGARIVKVKQFTDLQDITDHLPPQQPHPIVLCYLDNENETEVRHCLELLHADQNRHFRIVLLMAPDLKYSSPPPYAPTLDSAPLRRDELIKTIAACADRCSLPISVKDHIAKETIQPFANASHIRILVAEDNPVNQQVIEMQLKRLGIPCQVVDNGLQALAAWQQNDYQLILTDCHMPEMDGLQLTRTIREVENERQQNTTEDAIPIVAITANALRGESERCLNAGMNDFLPKPVEIRDLHRTLCKWLPELNPKFPLSPSTSTNVDSGNVVDLRILEELVGDDLPVQIEIVQSYLRDAPDNLHAIVSAANNHNSKLAGDEAHRLKSASKAIGANAFAELCLQVERFGRSQDKQSVVMLLPSLQVQFEAVQHSLEDWLQEHSS